MHDEAQRVDRVAGQQDVELDELGGAVAADLVVKRRVALGAALQAVEEVHDELAQRHLEGDLDGVLREVGHVLEVAAALCAKLHDGAHVVGRDDDLGREVGLLDVVDARGLGHVLRGVDHEVRAVCAVDVVLHAGGGGDEIEVELALEALLDHLHVQQAQETHAEAKAQGVGGLGLVDEGRVVERELVEGVAQGGVLVCVDGEHARVDHGLDVAVAGQGLFGAALGQSDGVAHLDELGVLDGGDEVAHLADGELVDRDLCRAAHADFEHLAELAVGHELDAVALFDGAVDDADERDHAAVGVEVGVEDERLERGVGVAFWGRDLLDDLLEQLVDADAALAAGEHRLVCRDGQAVFDLCADALRVCRGEVDLVDCGDDLEVGVHGHEGVGDRLGLDALSGVDHEHRALAGGEAARYLVGEVHVARGVDEVELVGLSVVCRVHDAHGLRLDGDAALALDVHGVEELLCHVALCHGARLLQDAVCDGGLTVVDVGDDGEVPDVLGIHGYLFEGTGPAGACNQCTREGAAAGASHRGGQGGRARARRRAS